MTMQSLSRRLGVFLRPRRRHPTATTLGHARPSPVSQAEIARLFRRELYGPVANA